MTDATRQIKDAIKAVAKTLGDPKKTDDNNLIYSGTEKFTEEISKQVNTDHVSSNFILIAHLTRPLFC